MAIRRFDEFAASDAAASTPARHPSFQCTSALGHRRVRSANYIHAIWRAGCLPIVLPAIGTSMAQSELLSVLDGVVLTGSISNVDPVQYGGCREGSKLYDEARDVTVFSLIRAGLQVGLPILGICRGLHELNVALGGSLYQNVHAVPGKIDHREDESLPRSIQYAPVHRVRFAPTGVLRGIIGAEEIHVSSLHWQGIERLADGLVVEATAEDGLIEAVTLRDSKTFAIGVQWHPEWFDDDPCGLLIFRAFARACAERLGVRRTVVRSPG